MNKITVPVDNELPTPRRRTALRVVNHLFDAFRFDQDWWKFSPLQW